MAATMDQFKEFVGTGQYGDWTGSFDTNPTAGSTLVAVLMYQTNSNDFDTFGISDPNDTWTLANSPYYEPTEPGSNPVLGIWYVENCTGGATTFTFECNYVSGGSGYSIIWHLYEFSSSGGTLEFVEVETDENTTGNPNAGTLNYTSTDNCMVAGTLSGTNPTAGTDWTISGSTTTGPNNYMDTQYQVDAAGTSESAAFGNTGGWSAVAAVFEVSAGGPSGPPAGSLALLGVGK